MKQLLFKTYHIFFSFFCLVVLALFFFHHSLSFASSTYFFPANYFPIAQKDIKEGSIISFSDQSYRLSRIPYDESMIGVVTNSPAIVQEIKSTIPSYAVLSTGQASILVSTINGSIKKGDLLTSSGIPGIAMKATTTGYTIGVALANYNQSNSKLIGKIPVDLNIRFSGVNLNALLKSVDIKKIELGLFLKYFLAFALVALALFFAFILISRTINRGMDALGRNPLASRHIHVGIALNVFVAIMLLATGFIMGYLILQL